MRDDMDKLLVESPRIGRSKARSREGTRRQRRERLDRDGESAPQRIGMRRDALSRKRFGEHLAPLYRYLRQQVHRPWAAVYGELCAALDRRSVVQAHVFEHLDARVARDTVWLDGEVQVRSWGRLIALKDSHSELFVHPRTGILLPNRARVIEARRRREARAQAHARGHPDRRTGLPGMSADCVWERIDGLWFEVRLAELDPDATKPPVFDAVLKRSVSAANRELLRATHGHPNCYAVAKRQLDRTTLKRHGLAPA